jgi:hypothetical protein
MTEKINAIQFYLISFAVSFLFLCCEKTNATAQSQRQIAHRSIKKSSVTLRDNRQGKESEKTTITYYNRKGKIIEQTTLSQDSTIIERSTFNYDKKGRLLEEKHFGSGGKTSSRKTMEYNKWDDPVSISEFNQNDTLETKTLIEYTKWGDKSIEVILNGNGQPEKKIDYFYDVKGMLVRRIIRNPAGDIIQEKTWDYTY